MRAARRFDHPLAIRVLPRTALASALALVCAGALAAGGRAAAQDEVDLATAIATASPGEANGHSFDRVVELDPEVRYVGGALVLEDVCIHGNGATLDLSSDYIEVLATGEPTRLDIDHCLIVNGIYGGSEDYYGGGLFYGEQTQGWIAHNTFYNNSPCGLYLAEVYLAAGGVKVSSNIFFGNAPWGLIRNEEQPDVWLRYNNSFGHGGNNYGIHCACPSGEPEQILPGSDDLDPSNRVVDAQFVELPNPPKQPGDFHLRPESPCIGTGEDNSDMGALPYVSTPAARSSWGALKSLYR